MARARAGTRPSRILTRATKLGIVVVALFAAAIFVLSRGDERADQPDVVLVGDSFAQQSADQFLSFARGEGLHAEVFAFGGSSICSWERQLTELVEREPKVLVLSFAGNDVHPCMNPDSIPNRSPEEVADLYRDQLDVVARQYREAGSRIYVVAPPPVKEALFEGYAAAMRQMYADYAEDHPEITVVETFEGLGPDGEYHKSLPCEEGEPCGPDGMVVLRQDDDIHLTPEGGKRYARMIMEAVEGETS
jgi:hypothetical protein